MKTTISIIISMTLSLSLLSGIGQLSQFAFYVCVIMNVLSWIGMLLGMVKDEVSAASAGPSGFCSYHPSSTSMP
ncbi:hypothetical protein [Pseudomonas aeruginosa]|uniref:hypothetical protein n=1 Tax=Pseudomonas aeruginosa TaxID=287 RepID=UPI0026599C86|nr:hypothetical protein [Pseudomonas aeruginosa]